MRVTLLILAFCCSIDCFAAEEKPVLTTPGAERALAKYSDAMAKAKAALAADLDKEIAAVMKSGKADALDVATALKKKKDDLCATDALLASSPLDGTTWSWGSIGEITLDKGGMLHTTWGDGTWTEKRSEKDIITAILVFGVPYTHSVTFDMKAKKLKST